MSEAHAFYPRRILTRLLCMAHLENTEENGFWPFSHLRIAGLAPSTAAATAAAVVPATTYAMVLFFRVESGKKPALHHIRVFKVLPPTAASDAITAS